jgi:integrase/recombinase XerD
MSKSDRELITELKAILTSQQYSPVVVGNYCAYARGFLDHLARRNILVADATEAQVEQYLCDAVALFQQRRGRRPGPRWHQTRKRPAPPMHYDLRSTLQARLSAQLAKPRAISADAVRLAASNSRRQRGGASVRGSGCAGSPGAACVYVGSGVP